MIKKIMFMAFAVLSMNNLQANFYDDAIKIKQQADQKAQLHRRLEAQKAIQSEQRRKIEQGADPKILNLANNWLVIVFFSSTCPHCKVFVPVIAKFIQDYGFQYQAYTLDGHALEDFKNPIMANPKLIKAFFGDKTIEYPAVFIVNEKSLDGIPVSIGELTYDEVKARFGQIANILSSRQGGHHA